MYVFDLQVDELKVKSIFEFDEEFESIRKLISPKTLLALDDEISSLQEAKRKLFQRLDSLLNKVSSSVCQYSEKVPTRAFSLLETPTPFTLKNLKTLYCKWAFKQIE